MQLQADSQITFLYFRDLEAPARFFEDILGLTLVEQQSFARIYRVAGSAFIGIVNGTGGFLRPQEQNAVLITMVTDRVDEWYEQLRDAGVNLLSDVQINSVINIKGFFFEGPGGYRFEVQQFLRPDLLNTFHKRNQEV